MRIEATRISKGARGIPLPESDVLYESASITIVEAEVGDQPTVLALILSGRMTPDTGTITLDGGDDADALRERIALVDAPEVSEPAADLPLRTVVREELLYAGRSTSRATVDTTIAEAGGSDYATARVADVPAAVRVRILAELASFRPGVQGVVLTSPDRHGGDPREWLAVARDLAARDFAVAVVCGAPSAELVRPLLAATDAATPADARAAAHATPASDAATSAAVSATSARATPSDAAPATPHAPLHAGGPAAPATPPPHTAAPAPESPTPADARPSAHAAPSPAHAASTGKGAGTTADTSAAETPTPDTSTTPEAEHRP